MKRGRNFAPEFETDIIFRQYISWTSNYSDSITFIWHLHLPLPFTAASRRLCNLHCTFGNLNR